MTRLVQIQNGADARAWRSSKNRACVCSTACDPSMNWRRRPLAAGTSLVASDSEKSRGRDRWITMRFTTGKSEWRLLPPIDHPGEPARCLVSGTGLTHLGSAKNRQPMHEAKESELTDSMKMFRLGRRRRQARAGQNRRRARMVLQRQRHDSPRATASRLRCQPYAEDGGEEAEIAGIYFVDANGHAAPHRHGHRQ